MGKMRVGKIIVLISLLMWLTINIFIFFKAIYVGEELTKLYEENKQLKSELETKTSMISDLEENCAKLFEELEYVKTKVGWSIDNYIEK